MKSVVLENVYKFLEIHVMICRNMSKSIVTIKYLSKNTSE